MTPLPFRMMGPKFKTRVWSILAPLRDLVLEQVCQERAAVRSSREGLPPHRGAPPCLRLGLEPGEAGAVRVPGFMPISTTSEMRDLRKVTEVL